MKKGEKKGEKAGMVDCEKVGAVRNAGAQALLFTTVRSEYAERIITHSRHNPKFL